MKSSESSIAFQGLENLTKDIRFFHKHKGQKGGSRLDFAKGLLLPCCLALIPRKRDNKRVRTSHRCF